MIARPTLAIGIALKLIVGACSAPSPGGTPAETIGSTAPDGLASAVLRLSGREVELAGGTCNWFEGAGELRVAIGPTAAGHWLRLGAPLSWVGEDLPPGASGTEAALRVGISGREIVVPAAALTGELASDLGTGTFDAGIVGGTPLSGAFDCPEVIEGD